MTGGTLKNYFMCCLMKTILVMERKKKKCLLMFTNCLISDWYTSMDPMWKPIKR